MQDRLDIPLQQIWIKKNWRSRWFSFQGRAKRAAMEWRIALVLAVRMTLGKKQIWSVPTLISLVGLALGVACLTAAMGVVSGFETTLKAAIVDVAGDIILVRRTSRSTSHVNFIEKIRKLTPGLKAITPFVNLEAVVAGSGKSAGVLLQGLDPNTLHQVLNIKKRVISGEFDISIQDQIPNAVVGKRFAKNFNLKVGDVFRVVVPVPSKTDTSRFDTRMQKFRLKGTLDLGKVEYDDRSIVSDLGLIQQLAGIGENVSGWRLRLNDSDQAFPVAQTLSSLENVWVMTWADVNANLFEAIKIEKPVIFFVILVMVIAAAFNVSTQLFVSVVARYPDVSILRAIGLPARHVRRIFIWQGLIVGVIGISLGLLLGGILLFAFYWAQKVLVLLPPETYKIDHIMIDVRFFDLVAVGIFTLFICWLATLVPARRAARLNPIEGLKYE